MHAASEGVGQLVKGALLSLAAVLAAAACSPGGSDNPAFSSPQSAPAVTAPGGSYSISIEGRVPVLQGAPAANSTIAGFAASLPADCRAKTELDTAALVSFAWACPGDRVSALTVTPAGRRLALGDLLTGSWAAYLSSVAAGQFSAEGRSGAASSDLSTWYLSPGALDVVFPAGIVAYPIGSLAPYLRPGVQF